MSDRTQADIQNESIPQIFSGRLGPGTAITLNAHGELTAFTTVEGYRYVFADDGNFRLSLPLAPTTERPITKEEAEDVCSICHTQYEVGEIVTVLPCVGAFGHWYHTECIEEWFKRSETLTCPSRCEQKRIPYY